MCFQSEFIYRCGPVKPPVACPFDPDSDDPSDVLREVDDRDIDASLLIFHVARLTRASLLRR